MQAMTNLTHYTLDNFVAYKLSLLTECGAHEIPTYANWLNAFILNSLIGFKPAATQQPHLFNFIRRAEGALTAYREARNALLEYLATPSNVVSPYFKALLYFEVCIAQCYQGYELLATASGQKFFQKGDNSAAERMGKLYNVCKHMNQMIDGGKIPPEASVAIWIANHGLESSRAKLSFDELIELLLQMAELAKHAAA